MTKEECLNKLRNLKGIQECIEGQINAVGYMALTGAIENYEQLINEHFDNSLNFKYFKLHSDSTLKSLKKDVLIDYIHILYENWKSADRFNESLTNYNLILKSELTKFDNPPLKFEDLHDEMWVYDNKYKEYCYIYFIAGKFLHRKYIDNCESDSEFEENRFYRFEVKE